MSDQQQTEEKGGSGAKIVGGVLGGAAVGTWAYKKQGDRVARTALLDHLSPVAGAEGAAPTYETIAGVDKLAKQTGRSTMSAELVAKAKNVVSPDQVTKFTNAGDVLKPTAAGAVKATKEEIKAAKTTQKEIIGAFKKALGEGEGKVGMLARLNTNQKIKVAGLAVAGIGAGAVTVNAIFGGKHTDKVEADRTIAQTQEASRA